MHRHVRLAGVALLGLVLTACVPLPAQPASLTLSVTTTPLAVRLAPEPQAQRDPETTQVTLDIFSGRPDPAWTLPAGQAQVLRALLEPLPEVDCGPMDLPLGYRGFVVLLGQRPELSNEYRLRVSAGQIRWGDPLSAQAPVTCRGDAGR